MDLDIRAIHAWAETYDSELHAGDERFSRTVLVIHEEGSIFYVMRAFLVDVNDTWIVMFSEHQGYRVWHKEDLAGMAQFANRGAPDPITLKPVREPKPVSRADSSVYLHQGEEPKKKAVKKTAKKKTKKR